MTNNELKIFASLKHKKFRQEQGLFLVEGYKSIEELLKSNMEIERIIGSEKALQKLTDLDLDLEHLVIEPANSKSLQRISNMKSAADLIAIVHVPKAIKHQISKGSILIDNIQDPGNLGTIIRTAHWFGFKQIICSKNSVDVFNHKVIQASMGALFKMQVSYADLEQVIPDFQQQNFNILGTFMEGESIYNSSFSDKDIFVLGNEGQGISQTVEALVDKKITIPNFSQGERTESLNISIAGAVVCSEIARQLTFS